MTIFIFKQGNAFNGTDNDYDYHGESIFNYHHYDQLLIRAMLAMIMLILMNQWYGHDQDHHDES